MSQDLKTIYFLQTELLIQPSGEKKRNV